MTGQKVLWGKKAGHKCDELLQIHILNAVKYVKQQMPIIWTKTETM